MLLIIIIRDTPPPETKESSLNSSSEIPQEEMEISQPITSPPSSRQPTPTRHFSSNPPSNPSSNPSTAPTSLSSSPVPASSVDWAAQVSILLHF